MATVGIHLIWTTYGTWLPGDKRGHWSPLFDFYGHLIKDGGQLNGADLQSHEYAAELMKEPATILDDTEISVVAQTLGTLVRWPNQDRPLPWIYAAAIEKNHVHLLLAPTAEPIGTVAGRFKGKTSSAVLKLPQNQGRERTWTAKYWKVFLFDALALAAVKQYIEDHNIRRGLAPSPFPWISPIEHPP